MSVRTPIYLDNNATTRVDPHVLAAMLPFFCDAWGNAASNSHEWGWSAQAAVDKARKQVADLLGADPKEIVFTSGATESNSLALKGVVEAYAAHGDHIITVRTEHKAVLDTCKRLENRGTHVTYLGVDPDGLLDPEQLRNAFTDQTVLVSVMAANNEIGVLQPLAALGALCRERGVLFHTDAVQAFGKVPLDVDAMNIDLASLTAHKMYGPKGVGALYVRRKPDRVRLAPQIDGGGHEQGFRSGTLNVPGIVGFGEAAALCAQTLESEAARLTYLREKLRRGIMDALNGTQINGHPVRRLPGNLNLSFAGVDSESLLLGLRDVALSSGSACSSASVEPSHVLRALGIGDERAHASLRFGLGRFTTEEEIDHVVVRVVAEVCRLKESAPV